MASVSAALPPPQLRYPSQPSGADQFHSARRLSTVRSHYRPFSTLYSSPPIEFLEPEPKPRPKSINRRRSFGAFQALGTMGFTFKDIKDIGKDKDKETRTWKTSDIQLIRPSPSARSNSVSTPSIMVERPSGPSQGRFALPRMKKKRSLASLLSPDSAPLNPAPQSLVNDPSSSTSLQPSSDSTTPTAPTSEDDEDEDDYENSHKYVRKNVWTRRGGMQLHPYALDAPYMQAYNPILLENDHQTDILLRRLNPITSPSFHDYGKHPPTTVLDLGCGQGHWVLQAAMAWRQSHITGFDLVNVTLPSLDRLENVEFVRGNFLKYQLPFPENHFDMVRMANLSLCIPYDKWEYVLTEVRRVLTVGGRLELIDDQIFFPYGEAPSPSTPVSPASDLDLFDEDEDDEYLDDDTTLEDDDDNTSTIFDDGDSSEKDKRSPPSSISDAPAPPLPSPSLTSTSPLLPHDISSNTPISAGTDASSSTVRPAPWGQQASASRDVETVFEDMLKKKFRIHPRPSEFLLDLMKTLFGKPATHKLHSFHLKLAPPSSSPSGGGGGSSEVNSDIDRSPHSSDPSLSRSSSLAKKTWMNIDWDKKEKRGRVDEDPSPSSPAAPIPTGKMSAKAAGRLGISYPASDKRGKLDQVVEDAPSPLSAGGHVPGKMSAKAADRLGISYSALAAASASSARPRSISSSRPRCSVPTQSPGLILWPSTFIPLPAAELEMHACRYIHTLLGCRAALGEFISTFTDDQGGRLVEDDEFDNSIWEYECFRRRRFNWPSEIPETALHPATDSSTAPPASSPGVTRVESLSSAKSSLDSTWSFHHEQLTHVRTLRVFEAVKNIEYLKGPVHRLRKAPRSGRTL